MGYTVYYETMTRDKPWENWHQGDFLKVLVSDRITCLTLKQIDHLFQNIMLFSSVVHYKSNIFA